MSFHSSVAGEDFDGENLVIIFTTGPASIGDTACANLTIIDDDAVEGDHAFILRLSSVELEGGVVNSGLLRGSPSEAAINIMDNDGTYPMLC